jgi:hypothetical protein
VRRILDHRAKKGGGIEYEVEWADKKINGEPWPNWWMPKVALTVDLIDAYMAWRSHGVPEKLVTIDASVAYEELRRKLANVMMNGAPNSNGAFVGPNRPRVHKLPIEGLSLLDVALGVLEVARKYGGPPMMLKHGNKGQDDEWWQLVISDLDRVSRRLLQLPALSRLGAHLGECAPHGQAEAFWRYDGGRRAHRDHGEETAARGRGHVHGIPHCSFQRSHGPPHVPALELRPVEA